MKRLLFTAATALLIAGCGGTQAQEADLASKSDKSCSDYWAPQEIYAEEKKLSEADKAALDKDGNGQYCDEKGVDFKTVADTIQHAEVGDKIEQTQFAGEGKVVGVWQINSARIDQQRKIDPSDGGGIAQGPFLVMEVSYTHKGQGYPFVGKERMEVFTTQTVHDPSMSTNMEMEGTYGFRDGEWYSFGDRVGPGGTLQGLVLVDLQEDEEPRFVKIYSDSAASPDSYPIAEVDLSHLK